MKPFPNNINIIPKIIPIIALMSIPEFIYSFTSVSSFLPIACATVIPVPITTKAFIEYPIFIYKLDDPMLATAPLPSPPTHIISNKL